MARKYAEGGKVKSLGNFVKDKKGYIYKVHHELPERNQVSVQDMNQDGFVFDKDEVKSVLKPQDWDETGWEKEVAPKGLTMSEIQKKIKSKYPNHPSPPVKKAFGGVIKRAVGKAMNAAMPQTPLDAGATPDPVSQRRPPMRNARMARMAPANRGRMPLHKMLAELDGDIRSNDQQLASAQVNLAGGGKVGSVKPALGRLKVLADKFEAALANKDHQSIVTIARQLDAQQPGLSKELMDSIANEGAADKLATFAKGGKVGKVLSAAERMKDPKEIMARSARVSKDLDNRYVEKLKTRYKSTLNQISETEGDAPEELLSRLDELADEMLERGVTDKELDAL